MNNSEVLNRRGQVIRLETKDSKGSKLSDREKELLESYNYHDNFYTSVILGDYRNMAVGICDIEK